jgi:hypothetical protein
MEEEMLVGYMRVSKSDGSHVTDLQPNALLAAGVDARHFYEDAASGKRDDRPGLVSVANIIDVNFADSDQLIRGFGDNHHQLA